MWMNQQNDNEYLQRLHSKDRAQPLLGRRNSATIRTPLLEAAQDTESERPRGRPASRRRPPGGAGRGGAGRAAARRAARRRPPLPRPPPRPPTARASPAEGGGARGRPASRRRRLGGAGRGGAGRAAAWQLPPSPCAQPPDLNCRFSDCFALVVSAPLFYLVCRPLLDFSSQYPS
jgi:hypothetical protein